MQSTAHLPRRERGQTRRTQFFDMDDDADVPCEEEMEVDEQRARPVRRWERRLRLPSGAHADDTVPPWRSGPCDARSSAASSAAAEPRPPGADDDSWGQLIQQGVIKYASMKLSPKEVTINLQLGDGENPVERLLRAFSTALHPSEISQVQMHESGTQIVTPRGAGQVLANKGGYSPPRRLHWYPLTA